MRTPTLGLFLPSSRWPLVPVYLLRALVRTWVGDAETASAENPASRGEPSRQSPSFASESCSPLGLWKHYEVKKKTCSVVATAPHPGTAGTQHPQLAPLSTYCCYRHFAFVSVKSSSSAELMQHSDGMSEAHRRGAEVMNCCWQGWYS